MKSKILTALLLLTMIINLTACGDKSAEKENGQTISTSKSESAVDESSSDTTSDEVDSFETENNIESEKSSSAESQAEQNSASKPTPNNTQNQQPQTQAPQTSQPTPQTNANSAPDTSPPETIKNASTADAEAIANKILEYINQYRTAQGAGAATKLSGLTQVAQYRSKQLVTNYAHDTNDEREAATAFKYGKHVVIEETRWDAETQSVVKTGNILDYYDACCGEAIGRSGGNASIDEIAKRMANSFKDSANHWSYVGAARNKYIAVGATYGNGQWYICILTSETNTYG